MPLASTVKILIVIEHAKQFSEGILNTNEWIPLFNLNMYYIQGTDILDNSLSAI